MTSYKPCHITVFSKINKYKTSLKLYFFNVHVHFVYGVT